MLSSTAMDDSVPEQERAAADTALIAHRELCIPKGSRFFTTHKNEACAKTLQSFVREFLEGRDLIRFNFKGEKMQENRLERDVRVAAASEVVKVELAAGSVVYYAIFGPALALVKLVKDMQGVAEIVLLIDLFLHRILEDPSMITRLVSDRGDVPITFVSGTHLEKKLQGLSKAAAAIRENNAEVDIDIDASAVANNLRLQAEKRHGHVLGWPAARAEGEGDRAVLQGRCHWRGPGRRQEAEPRDDGRQHSSRAQRQPR
mmetsp:Transcript_32679/g.80209  ORF Transcript_32679/g.80209 Transcript_32679/m.80209 type:complete len:259 (+) Transcript_32679:684-1460(+)